VTLFPNHIGDYPPQDLQEAIPEKLVQVNNELDEASASEGEGIRISVRSIERVGKELRVICRYQHTETSGIRWTIRHSVDRLDF
jgi:hypothetical protein